ncbi:galectin-9C-like [Tiliqua scincoides]|uniref:galectin-9C-like n=1 Tax=Tiliqua scincoides TaxID=71010 RepID=UPI0034638481
MGAGKSLVDSKDIELLKVGTIISISACVPPCATRFSIDLAGLDKSIPFQFSARYNEQPAIIVCNTFFKYMWGSQERTSGIPFQQGESFKMTITVKTEYYEVSINGERFLRYVHRVPYHTVKKVEFKGDISIEEISFSSAQDPPPYSPPVHAISKQNEV